MKKILIIDDDILNFQIYATKLRFENFEVELCSNGLEALEKIKNDYDLLLLDIMMPKLDGTQILSELKKKQASNTIILIYTNLLSEETKKECLENGAKDYLLKADFTPTQLVDRIKQYLMTENREQRTENREQIAEKQNK